MNYQDLQKASLYKPRAVVVSHVACTITIWIVCTITGRGAGDVSENDFVDKMMRRLEGHGSSLTTSVKNDTDWESFNSATFYQKVNLLFSYLLSATFVNRMKLMC